MARVPTIQRQVRATAMPDVRQGFTPSAASFGAGLARGVTETASRLYLARQQSADEAALLEFDNQLAGWEHSRLHDPQSGVLNTVKGKAALDLPNTLGDEFDELTSEAIGKLQPRQQQAAQRLAQRRREGIVGTLDNYGSREGAIYEQEQVDASLKTSVQLGIANATDPLRLKTELDRQAMILEDAAQKQGLPPELRDRKIQEFRTATLTGAISQLLTLDKDQAAQVLFEETKHQIDGDAWPKIEQALEESSLRRSSQQTADAISAKATTLTEARDAVKTIEDPKLRDAVQQRVEHDWSVREAIERDAHEQQMKDAANLIDAGKKVPPSLWVTLSIGEREALEAYQKRNLKGDAEGKTDLVQYYRLITTAAEQPEQFAKTNLLMYLPYLAKTEFKQLAELQGSIRKGDKPKTDAALDGFLSESDIVNQTLDLARIPRTGQGADPAVVARFRRTVNEQTTALERLTGKKATKDDIQKIADDVLSRGVLVPNGWLWSLMGQPFSGKRLITVTVDDVPATDRRQIEDVLTRMRQPVTDENVLQLYIDQQLRSRK